MISTIKSYRFRIENNETKKNEKNLRGGRNGIEGKEGREGREGNTSMDCPPRSTKSPLKIYGLVADG